MNQTFAPRVYYVCIIYFILEIFYNGLLLFQIGHGWEGTSPHPHYSEWEVHSVLSLFFTPLTLCTLWDTWMCRGLWARILNQKASFGTSGRIQKNWEVNSGILLLRNTLKYRNKDSQDQSNLKYEHTVKNPKVPLRGSTKSETYKRNSWIISIKEKRCKQTWQKEKVKDWCSLINRVVHFMWIYIMNYYDDHRQ